MHRRVRPATPVGAEGAAQERHLLPRIEGFNCFACGTENPHGLQLRFYQVGDEVRSDVVLDARFVGWENMAHGGVVTTLLDEVMAWTILYTERIFCVTREITVKYLRPVPVGVPLTVRARSVERLGRQYARQLEGEVVDRDGAVLATASADFALLRREKVELLPERVRAEMERFLAALGPPGSPGHD